MSYEDALGAYQRSVPECIAVGVVDLQSGMLLGINTVDSQPQEVIDLAAAATGELFMGSNVAAIERLFRRSRGQPDDDSHHYNREVIALSDSVIHLFQRGQTHEDIVICTICRISANLGMILARSRLGVPRLEELFSTS